MKKRTDIEVKRLLNASYGKFGVADSRYDGERVEVFPDKVMGDDGVITYLYDLVSSYPVALAKAPK